MYIVTNAYHQDELQDISKPTPGNSGMLMIYWPVNYGDNTVQVTTAGVAMHDARINTGLIIGLHRYMRSGLPWESNIASRVLGSFTPRESDYHDLTESLKLVRAWYGQRDETWSISLCGAYMTLMLLSIQRA